MTKNIYTAWFEFCARFYRSDPCYWDELKCHGYTIERHHIKGFYICTPYGKRCGPIYGNYDQLMGNRESIAKLELSRLEEGKNE